MNAEEDVLNRVLAAVVSFEAAKVKSDAPQF